MERIFWSRALGAALALLPGACATPATSGLAGAAAAPDDSWQTRAVGGDAAQLLDVAGWWTPALAAARPRFAKAIAREGALLDPAIALDHVALPPGSYKCRAVTLGGPRRLPAYRSAAPAFCYVRGEASGLTFGKQTGDERLAGWLYADGDTRYVLLGAYARGRATPPGYGTPGARHAVGVIERIGPFRWRVTLAPSAASVALTVYDLTPVPVEQQAP